MRLDSDEQQIYTTAIFRVRILGFGARIKKKVLGEREILTEEEGGWWDKESGVSEREE